MMRAVLTLTFVSLLLAACGRDDRPVVVNTPPQQPSSSTVIVPAPTQAPTVVVPQQ